MFCSIALQLLLGAASAGPANAWTACAAVAASGCVAGMARRPGCCWSDCASVWSGCGRAAGRAAAAAVICACSWRLARALQAVHSRIDAAGVDDDDRRAGRRAAARAATPGTASGKRGERRAESEFVHQNAVPTLKVNSLVSSPCCLEQRLGDIDAERTERRVPVDAEADRQARLRQVAEEVFR